MKAMRTRHDVLIVLLWICAHMYVWGINSPAKCDGIKAADEKTLRVIAEGSIANRRSFDFFSCEFAVTWGYADSESEAMEHGPKTIVEHAKGLWYVNSQKCRFEIRSDPNATVDSVRRWLDSHKQDDMSRGIRVPVGAKLPARKLLWDGERGVSVSGLLGGGGLIPMDRSGPGVQISPFDMAGWMGRDEERHPAALIERALSGGDIDCRFDGRDSNDKESLLSIRLTYPSSPETGCVIYRFDAKKGFLPVQMQRTKPPVTVFVTHVKQCGGMKWFPMRTVSIQNGPSELGSAKVEVMEVVVKRLDIKTPPNDALFAIELPRGTKIHNSVNPLSQLSFPDGRMLPIGDLAKLEGEMSTAVDKRESDRKVEVSARERRGPGIWLWVVLGNVALVLLLAFLFARRRRNQAE